MLPKAVKSSKLNSKKGSYPAGVGLTSGEAKMSFISKVALASVLTLSSAIGGALALKTTEAEAKSSILYCGLPRPGNCTAYPYRTHGGRIPFAPKIALAI